MPANEKKKKKIGLLGAAFDPPHFGHLLLAQNALQTAGLDEIWLVPSPSRWDKSLIADGKRRLEWLQAAVQLCPEVLRNKLRVSDFELQQPAYRGTCWLVTELKRQNPDVTFSLVLGWDSFIGIPSWRDPTTGTMNGEQLLASTHCFVSPRPNAQEFTIVPHPAPHEGGVTMLPALDDPKIGEVNWMRGVTQNQVAALSSSLIRTALKQKADIVFVFPEIQAEILKSGIYDR
ncbi:MAG: hypothetical protein RIR26_1724 [Pseudomonadota bacterium]|jgi:nicotinate (nicotinamide) nucleotide adenylyltransferase